VGVSDTFTRHPVFRLFPETDNAGNITFEPDRGGIPQSW